jgi:hypothetical protein
MYTGKMYTGTIINDLMATVERVERRVFEKRVADEREMLRVFELQLSQMHSEPAYAGAA